MVDTGDLKSLARKGVRVQVPPRAPHLPERNLGSTPKIGNLTPRAGVPVSRCMGSGHVVARLLGISPAFHIFCAFPRGRFDESFCGCLGFFTTPLSSCFPLVGGFRFLPVCRLSGLRLESAF